MEKSVIIIGAGGAGLAAGCYARMNGFKATIFELHDKPGGLCTSWKRKGFMVDGCLHWLVGSGPAATGLHQCWLELGALQGREWLDHETFISVRAKDGKTMHVYTDVDRFERHLLELAPGDAGTIREFTGAVRKFTRFDMPLPKPKELRSMTESMRELLHMAPYLYPFIKYSRITIQDFAARFKDPFLRKAFAAPFDLPDFPTVAVMMTYAWMHNKTAGYPIGGSLEFARAIEKRFTSLGGEVRYKTRVKKITVENGKAVGVVLEDGTEHKADIVVSAGDGRAAIFDMLEGKFIDDEIRERYDKMPRFRSLVQVSLGVDRDMKDEPGFMAHELPEPVTIAGEELKFMSVHNYSYDPTSAPEGKSVIVVRFMADIGPWKKLKNGGPGYEEEKEKVSDAVIGHLETFYPGISEQIEMVDVATPLTFERYTANWEGSMEGWLITTKNIMSSMKKTLPGLENFYMVGQWVSPGGGLPSCAITARQVMQMICHQEGRQFVTSAP